VASVARHILLVEDDPDFQAVLQTALEGEGYHVIAAAHGREAMERLRHSPGCGLIVLDLRMPVMDGYQFRAEQMRDPTLAGIPVVVLSAEGDATRRAAELGAVEVMQKPVDFDRLLAILARYC
jgi:CheY-like chemotaxis protein